VVRHRAAVVRHRAAVVLVLATVVVLVLATVVPQDCLAAPVTVDLAARVLVDHLAQGPLVAPLVAPLVGYLAAAVASCRPVEAASEEVLAAVHPRALWADRVVAFHLAPLDLANLVASPAKASRQARTISRASVALTLPGLRAHFRRQDSKRPSLGQSISAARTPSRR